MRLIVVALAAGCGGTPPPEPAAPEQDRSVVEDVVVEPEARQRLDEDLDGDGFAEAIALDDANVLRIEGHPLRFSPDASVSIQVIDVDTADADREVLVTTSEGIEDPPNVFFLFGFRHGDVTLLLELTSSRSLGIGGDGTVRVFDRDWSACRASAGLVRDVQITFAADAPGGRFREIARTFTGGTFRCDEQAACPYVYAVDDEGSVTQVGEILRNVRGADAYTWQTLALPDAVRVRLTEEKDEVTYLDEIFLDVAGVHVAPVACSAAAPPAYCVADDRFHLMRRGDSLDLDFGGARGELVAGGYYLPLLL